MLIGGGTKLHTYLILQSNQVCPNMKRGAKNMVSSPILTRDLIIQIMIRLPAKSLQRFKCMSKSWLSLISSSHFANLHFELEATRLERLGMLMADDSVIHFLI